MLIPCAGNENRSQTAFTMSSLGYPLYGERQAANPFQRALVSVIPCVGSGKVNAWSGADVYPLHGGATIRTENLPAFLPSFIPCTGSGKVITAVRHAHQYVYPLRGE